ncbi:MAG: dihydroneopterin aldolase [Tannerellaceae bacterium]|jgi:dihydroneopterin aldolase|nr:dihydroneopterin aldolase [Tannerellaceae bacterium]
MDTRIELRGMVFHSHHGVLEQEGVTGNMFRVDVSFSAPVERAALSDDPADTVSYADVYEVIRREMAIPSQLLEHVAGRIFRSLWAAFPQISSLYVRITKPAPPIAGAQFTEIDGGASVILKESKEVVK